MLCAVCVMCASNFTKLPAQRVPLLTHWDLPAATQKINCGLRGRNFLALWITNDPLHNVKHSGSECGQIARCTNTKVVLGGVQCATDVEIQFMIPDHFRPSVARISLNQRKIMWPDQIVLRKCKTVNMEIRQIWYLTFPNSRIMI